MEIAKRRILLGMAALYISPIDEGERKKGNAARAGSDRPWCIGWSGVHAIPHSSGEGQSSTGHHEWRTLSTINVTHGCVAYQLTRSRGVGVWVDGSERWECVSEGDLQTTVQSYRSGWYSIARMRNCCLISLTVASRGTRSTVYGFACSADVATLITSAITASPITIPGPRHSNPMALRLPKCVCVTTLEDFDESTLDLDSPPKRRASTSVVRNAYETLLPGHTTVVLAAR